MTIHGDKHHSVAIPTLSKEEQDRLRDDDDKTARSETPPDIEIDPADADRPMQDQTVLGFTLALNGLYRGMHNLTASQLELARAIAGVHDRSQVDKRTHAVLDRIERELVSLNKIAYSGEATSNAISDELQTMNIASSKTLDVLYEIRDSLAAIAAVATAMTNGHGAT